MNNSVLDIFHAPKCGFTINKSIIRLKREKKKRHDANEGESTMNGILNSLVCTTLFTKVTVNILCIFKRNASRILHNFASIIQHNIYETKITFTSINLHSKIRFDFFFHAIIQIDQIHPSVSVCNMHSIALSNINIIRKKKTLSKHSSFSWKKNLFSFNSVLNVWLIVTIPSIHKFNAKGTDVDHGLTFDLAVYRIQYVRMKIDSNKHKIVILSIRLLQMWPMEFSNNVHRHRHTHTQHQQKQQRRQQQCQRIVMLSNFLWINKFK